MQQGMDPISIDIHWDIIIIYLEHLLRIVEHTRIVRYTMSRSPRTAGHTLKAFNYRIIG